MAVGTAALISGGSLYKIASLSGGGHTVAELMGGRLLHPQTTDPDERRILNVVEEMAIAAGTPVPPVYLLENEDGINAFAAGHSPNDAVVAVTRGCVRTLSRDELQGVVAHEFSHILNGDMRLNLRLMGVLFGILLIGLDRLHPAAQHERIPSAGQRPRRRSRRAQCPALDRPGALRDRVRRRVFREPDQGRGLTAA